VARALQGAGHRVVGRARAPERAERLREAGIEAVIGDLTDPASYAAVAAAANIVVHAAADGARGMVEPDRIALDTLIGLMPTGGAKAFIYTSGVWVHGDTEHRIVDEETPLRPVARVAWRPAHEKRARDAGGVVVRPGCVYGGAGGLTAAWFAAARDGVCQLVGSGENHWAMIHLQDLAGAYVAAAARGPARRDSDPGRARRGDRARVC
jgi:nucleoside-diphosphate-sugar epimerase